MHLLHSYLLEPTPQTGKGTEDWSRGIESTAKALEGKTKEPFNDVEMSIFRGSGKTKDVISETSKYASKKENQTKIFHCLVESLSIGG